MDLVTLVLLAAKQDASFILLHLLSENIHKQSQQRTSQKLLIKHL